MTKQQLQEQNEAQREMIAALGSEIDALYDIFAAVRESPRDAHFIVGYAGGIGGETDRGNVRLLRQFAARLRENPCPVITEPAPQEHAYVTPAMAERRDKAAAEYADRHADGGVLIGPMSDAECYDITGRTA